MRTMTFAMNLSLDGFVAAPGDDLDCDARLVTHSVLMGGGTPSDGVLLTRYETRR